MDPNNEYHPMSGQQLNLNDQNENEDYKSFAEPKTEEEQNEENNILLKNITGTATNSEYDGGHESVQDISNNINNNFGEIGGGVTLNTIELNYAENPENPEETHTNTNLEQSQQQIDISEHSTAMLEHPK